MFMYKHLKVPFFVVKFSCVVCLLQIDCKKKTKDDEVKEEMHIVLNNGT